MFTFIQSAIFALLISILLTGHATAGSLLHPLFSSNAVLQRDREVPVWGETAPNTEVEILLDDSKTTAVSDANGQWRARIGPRKAGVGHTLVVSTPAEKETRTNIAFGDVWLCSGQSNMDWRLFYGAPKKPVDNADVEAQNAYYPAIRLLLIPRVSALTPQKSFAGAEWKICDPQNVRNISAVGYFFGREIHQKTGVPIGLIDAAWGGTTAEVWTSAEALDALPDFKGLTDGVKNTRADVPYQTQYEDFVKKAAAESEPTDTGLKNGWLLPDFDDSSWKVMQLPSYWENLGIEELKAFDGVVWFRRQIELDEAAASSGDVTIDIGPVDDFDTVYWNGQKIGSSTGYETPRSYKVPASMLKAGPVTIVIRVVDPNGGGGFGAKPEAMQLRFANGTTLPLAGPWKYSIGGPMGHMPASPVNIGKHTTAPTILFNGMISPLLPYGIKGAIWYQGEANATEPEKYETLLPALIGDWRGRFASGDFPFYIVQLAAFRKRDEQPGQSLGGWPKFREAQEKIAAKVKNSGIAITTDIGDEADIHPTNKQDVGKRLAALALKNDYGQNNVASGPTLQSAKTVGNTLVLELVNTGGELTAKGDLAKAFIIAGEDKKWAWGQVVSLENDPDSARVVLTAPEVAVPVAARFGWANFPLGHLYNKDGFPAAPFRSDDW
jgi:sialate O-acetylesterase